MGDPGGPAPHGATKDSFARAILALALYSGRRRALLIRYASAPLAAAISAGVQAALFREPSYAPFVFMDVGVALSAGLAGRGPGLLCVLISALVANRHFLPPTGVWTATRPALIATGLFLISGVPIALVCAYLRTAFVRMEAFSRELARRGDLERRLRAIYDLQLIGILYWTTDGRVTDANDKFLAMTGYTREDLTSGRIGWAEMTPPEWRHLDERALEDFRTRGISPPFEKEIIRKDGSRFPILVGGSMLDESRTEGVAFIVDITERKEAERALKESQEALRVSDERKSEFLGILSHELRNPLAAIRIALDVIGHSAPGSDPAARATAVVDRQVLQLTRLTDDLLDVTRISRGKIRLRTERLDIIDAVRSTVEDHRGLLRNLAVDFEVTTDAAALPVRADPARVRQMIGNLLENVAKFTPSGGHATISVGRADPFAVVTVRDDGVGIPPASLPLLFEPFVQSETTLDRSVGGLGIGLALVKGLAVQHGGDISVQSGGVGQGATFVLRLPLETRAAPKLALVSPSREQSARRVLLIEDNRDAAETMRDALELSGHVVEVAYAGTEGIEKARRFQPDVILCDIGLPSMDGYEVARALRAEPSTRSIRLIALSGYAQPEDLDKARAAGFDLHVAKPIALSELELRMREVGARG